MKAKLFGVVVVLALIALGYFELTTDTPSGDTPGVTGARPPAAAPSTDGIRLVVDEAAIKNYGTVIYRGPVDLTATIERIRAGIEYPHRNDGSIFGNRERLLPSKPRGYYREYVHPTDGLDGPGPQRLVVGRDGDWWYTPDHYASFIELGREAR